MPEEKSPQEILEEQKKNCPFCKIIAGDFPAKKIYEDDKMIAVLDINPAVKGHALVMPKEHYPLLAMVPAELSQYFFQKTKEIAKSIQEAMLTKGIELFIASGGAAGQQVPHFMLHLVPRDDDDNLSNFEIKEGVVEEEKLKEIKEKIAANLKGLSGKKMPVGEVTKEKLIELVESNPKLKALMLEKTDEFKQMVQNTPQLKQLFGKFDVDEIIKEVKEKQGSEDQEENKDESGEKNSEPEKKEEKVKPNNKESKEKKNNKKSKKLDLDSIAEEND